MFSIASENATVQGDVYGLERIEYIDESELKYREELLEVID